MKKTIISVIFSALAVTLSAQLNTFNLSDYKLPDIRLHRLDFSTEGYNSLSNNVSETGGVEDKYRYTYGNFNLSATYFKFRNSLKYRGTQQFSIYGYAQSNSSKSEPNLYKYNNYPLNFNINSANRYYLNTDLFIEANPVISNNYTYRKTRQEGNSTSVEKRRTNQLNMSIPVSVGIGRMDPVEDARQAVYILEELEKSGRLKSRPSDETIIEFSRLISKMKNERFFDSRLKKIEELQRIDSFLISNGITTQNDIVTFTTVNDMWDYGDGPFRNSGSLINAGIKYSLNAYKYRYTRDDSFGITEDTTTNSINTIGIFASYRRSIPSSLKIQKDISAEAGYRLEMENYPVSYDAIREKTNTGILYLDLDYTLGYYPSTRTYMSASAGILAESLSGDRTQGATEGKYNGFFMAATLGADVTYYVSPRLRLSGYLETYYNMITDKTRYGTNPENKTTQRNFSNYLYLRIIYSLF